MKCNSILVVTAAILFSSVAVPAQFPIKLPKITKAEKPRPASTEPSTPTNTGRSQNSQSSTKSGRVYENQTPSGTPVVIQPLVFIQAANSNDYWKMPNVRGATSWIPEINLQLFWDDSSPLQTFAEYYNPDGSLWFTEQLQTAGKTLRSNETWSLINSKSTNAIGVYSVKVKNKANGAVIYAGKFKVNKFLASFNTADKNKLGFYVDHDWLVPLGMVSFDTGDLTKGAPERPAFSVWLKGKIEYTELEAQLYLNGKMIASKQVNSGASADERISKFSVPFDTGNIIKRWVIEFENVVFANGNPYYAESYANSHFVEKNPGQYTFKLLRNGTQVREFSFNVGADGRFVRPAYSDSFIFPQHGILIPAKVMGNTEKWNTMAWKTEMFYGNPIAGFSAQ